jgi:hypothetical protein
MNFIRLLLFISLITFSKTSAAFSPAKLLLPSDSSNKAIKPDTTGQAWLIKRWVCTDISNPEIDTVVTQLTTKQLAALKRQFREMTWEFKSNGKGRGVIDGKMQEGGWELALKAQTLFLINAAGARDEGTIVKLSPDKLIIKKGDNRITFIPY